MAERHKAGIADQDIESHACNCEHHHVDRRAQRQAGKVEGIGKDDQRDRGDEQWQVALAHRHYSNLSMRSPKSPRGRSSSTNAMSRYIDASPQDGLK